LDLNLLQITSGGGGTTIVIQVLQDGVPILTLLNNGITFPLGHSSYPFTIADTAGLPSLIEVQTNDGFGGIFIAFSSNFPDPASVLVGNATLS
jgi:hypothetical protein